MEGGLLPATGQEHSVVVPEAASAFQTKEASIYLHTKSPGVSTVAGLLHLRSTHC